MAFAEIKKTGEIETKEYKKFIGITPVQIVALNPDKAEMEALGFRTEEEPVYTRKSEHADPITQQVRQIDAVNLSFYIRNEEIGLLTRFNIYLENTPWVSASGKVKVIDKYGRTAWVTQEQFKAKEAPVYQNGQKARISPDYRPSYRNEEELIKLLKYYFGIPDVDIYRDGQWVMTDKPEECEVSLEKIKDYFKGDVSEIKKYLKMAEGNWVKVLLGVRIKDGKVYQDVYTRDFMRSYSKSTKMIEKNVKNDQENGSYPNSIFKMNPVEEYVDTKAPISNHQAEEETIDPFTGAPSSVSQFYEEPPF